MSEEETKAYKPLNDLDKINLDSLLEAMEKADKVEFPIKALNTFNAISNYEKAGFNVIEYSIKYENLFDYRMKGDTHGNTNNTEG